MIVMWIFRLSYIHLLTTFVRIINIVMCIANIVIYTFRLSYILLLKVVMCFLRL